MKETLRSADRVHAPARPFAMTLLLVLAALEQCLQSVGCKITPGAGVAAANKVYAG